ncbi:MAG: hypothetical protein HY926_04600 [Elusimicrobia bacterium]|nr:hypothetical protein [Elusimicrobiota bacterium]
MKARGARRRGSTLLETMLAILIMTTVGLALLAMVQKSLAVSLKAREQMSCSRMVQTGFSRIKNLDFYYLFAADSSLSNHGLWAAYPYKAVLDGLQATLAASRFDRFRVQVTFMRRDISDANGDGRTSDLIQFTDNNSDNADDYDTGIRYFDQNGDLDFYDTYVSGGRTVAEQPDTHIKKVTFDVFRRGRLVCSQTELVSLEGFSGDVNPSSEASLALLVSTPSNNAFLYALDTAGRVSAWNLPIAKAYPSDILRYRADAVSPLLVSGETDPLAAVNLYVNSSGILASPAADMSGAFSASPAAVTAALAEGADALRGQAVKDAYTSPIAARALILDLKAPVSTGTTPSGTVPTRSPYVSALLSDPGISTSVTSGICPDVVTLRINGVEVNHSYSQGPAVWIDSTTGTVPVLDTGTYTAVVEFGDYAGYKASATWTFTVEVPDTDNSAPAIAQKSPIGMAPSTLPEISVKVFDNQSGIIPASIVLKLDGAVVVDASNIGSRYDAGADRVFYTPGGAFAPGSAHTVEVTASHWANDPLDKVTSSEAWDFTVP